MVAKRVNQKALSVPGFQCAGVSCGIKARSEKDLALIYSEVPAVSVGTFTTHPAAAAPVLLSRRAIEKADTQAVVINSGNANASTGARGKRDAEAMVTKTARCLGIAKSRVLVCSTGVIGVPLPMPRILKGIELARSNLKASGVKTAADAIMTTDRSSKIASFQGRIGKQPYRICAFAKGAGMIEPQMATMLAFIMTDLALDRRFASQVLKEAVDLSFNRISVDGDRSTNDTCLLLANGLAGNPPLKSGRSGARAFQEALLQMTSQLAFAMVADGEGATKVVCIRVKEAKNRDEARRLTYGIANSQLVRTSFYGADPNWGRVLVALGNAGATCPPSKVTISYGGVCVCRGGAAVGAVAERRAKKIMQRREFTVEVNCHSGRASHTILSSDLSLDYVKLNSNYRS